MKDSRQYEALFGTPTTFFLAMVPVRKLMGCWVSGKVMTVAVGIRDLFSAAEKGSLVCLVVDTLG